MSTMWRLFFLVVAITLPRGAASFSMPASGETASSVSSFSPFAPDPATAPLKRELYELCEGTRNGVDADPETRKEIARVVKELEAFSATSAKMTDLPLRGSRHELLYCESEGGSSGKIGPFVGKVEQLFASNNNKDFTNAVTLGPFRLELSAERKTIDEKRIRVKFLETAASLLGFELFAKPTKGAGIWTQRFVDDELRIMDTPSLFIIRRTTTEEEKAPTLVDVLRNPADFIADDE